MAHVKGRHVILWYLENVMTHSASTSWQNKGGCLPLKKAKWRNNQWRQHGGKNCLLKEENSSSISAENC